MLPTISLPRSIGILLLTCVMCFDLPARVSSLAQSSGADAVRGLVGRLFELYQQKDIDRLISLWSEKSSFLAGDKKSLQNEFAAYEKIAVKGFDIRQTKIEGDRVTLRVVAETALTRTKMVKAVEKIEKKNRTIELVNEGGIWKVWKFVASEEELAAAIVETDEQSAIPAPILLGRFYRGRGREIEKTEQTEITK